VLCVGSGDLSKLQFQVKLEPGLKAGSNKEDAKKKPHIKKPLNAFMLYMKEMRPKVQGTHGTGNIEQELGTGNINAEHGTENMGQ
jgi:hypothetical protein